MDRNDTFDLKLCSAPLFSPLASCCVAKLHSYQHHEAVDSLRSSGVGDVFISALALSDLAPILSDHHATDSSLEPTNDRFLLVLLPNASNFDNASQSSQGFDFLLVDSLSQVNQRVSQSVLGHG